MSTAERSMTVSPAVHKPIRAYLGELDEMLSVAARTTTLEVEFFAHLVQRLKSVHAILRARQAQNYLGEPLERFEVDAPALACIAERLRSENSVLIGRLDSLIHTGESVSDHAPEDQQVFFLRVREFSAIMRRHDGEEERMFAVALWRDTGGDG